MVGPAAAHHQALLALPALLALILFGAVHETAAAQCTCSNIFAAICSPFGSCSCPAKLPYKKGFIGCGPTTGSTWKVPSCRSNYGSDTILDVAVSPDGNYAVAGTRKGTLELIDAHTGDCVATAMTGTGINSLAITSDGKKMFTADYASNTIRVWHNGSATTKLSGHTDTVNAVAMVSGITKKLVSAGQDRTLRLWDLTNYKLLKTIQTGHTNFITGLAVSSDGSKAATSSQDGTIRISSLGYVSQLKVLRTPTGSSPPLSVAFTPDGKRLVAGTANSVEVWDVSSGKVLKSFMLPFSFTYSVAVSPNGKFAVSGGREGVVRFWNLATLKEASNYAVPGGARAADLVSVAVSPDNKGAVAGAGEVLIRFSVEPNTGVGRVLGRGPL